MKLSRSFHALRDGAFQNPCNGESAQQMYRAMLRKCGNEKNLAEGRRIHEQIVSTGNEADRFLGNHLIEMYGKCGSLQDARRVFDKICVKNIYTWTIMMKAFASNGRNDQAIQLFCEMDLCGMRPNQVTYLVAVEACSSLEQARLLHAEMVLDGNVHRDQLLGNAVITMYGRFGSLVDAAAAFEAKNSTIRDVVTWNAMIAAYAQNGHYTQALELFQRMDLEPDQVTFISLIDACASLGSWDQGREIHSKMTATGVAADGNLGNAMVNFYGRCGCLEEAKDVFEKMQKKDVVTWNSILAANARNGHYKEVLEMYQKMELKPDQLTFLAVLDACANLTALGQGSSTHSTIRQLGLDTEVLVGNSLVFMYAKCGSVEDAKLAFDRIRAKDRISWTALMAAHCQNGYAVESLQLFVGMQHQGILPDTITYGCVLSACSYAGIVQEGRKHFMNISSDYGLSPNVDCYCSMVDVFSRAGWLEYAEDLINSMPFLPHSVTWTMLLGACKVYGDVHRGKRIAEQVFKLNPKDHVPHVLLSNLYAAAGRSWIEVGNTVHEFLVGDTKHERSEEIYAELQRLSLQIEQSGYVPNTNEVLHDIEEDTKGHIIGYHSEKLAIAFGIISTQPGTMLRIMKNLRMCSDCHAAAKYISKVTHRKIIVRDANRFHHLADGACTCGDYW